MAAPDGRHPTHVLMPFILQFTDDAETSYGDLHCPVCRHKSKSSRFHRDHVLVKHIKKCIKVNGEYFHRLVLAGEGGGGL